MIENKTYKTNYRIEDPSIVKTDILQPIEYAYKTGLPDNGCITIRYRPDECIVELKSLKYYLLQFRNVGMFYEHVVNKILDDLVCVLKPLRMEVTGEFTPRGGVSSIATAVYEKE